jgi:hypothetical protein
MAVTKEDKAAFADAIKEPKRHIEESVRHIKEVAVLKKKHPNIAGYYNLEMAMDNLRVCMFNLNMNDASMRIMQLKNSKYLDDARRSFSNALLLLEEIVGNDIDRPWLTTRIIVRQIDQINIRNGAADQQEIALNFDTMVDR